MLSTQALTATCEMDGAPVVLRYFSDTRVLLIADQLGRKIRETHWQGSWESLLSAVSGLR